MDLKFNFCHLDGNEFKCLDTNVKTQNPEFDKYHFK